MLECPGGAEPVLQALVDWRQSAHGHWPVTEGRQNTGKHKAVQGSRTQGCENAE